jgi:hypothetical protein
MGGKMHSVFPLEFLFDRHFRHPLDFSKKHFSGEGALHDFSLDYADTHCILHRLDPGALRLEVADFYNARQTDLSDLAESPPGRVRLLETLSIKTLNFPITVQNPTQPPLQKGRSKFSPLLKGRLRGVFLVS